MKRKKVIMVFIYKDLRFETNFFLFLEKHIFFLELKAERYLLLVLTKRTLYNGVYRALENIFIIDIIIEFLGLKKIKSFNRCKWADTKA